MSASHQEKLLLLLDELQKRLSSPDGSGAESNPSQMFAYFLENSSAGSECSYARKALLLFMKRDYQDIKKLVYDIVRTMKILDENHLDE